MTSSSTYAIIATAAATVNGASVSAGTVINRVLWDGAASWSPPSGTEARADPTGALPIGSTTTV
jgi:hypothetical protein